MWLNLSVFIQEVSVILHEISIYQHFTITVESGDSFLSLSNIFRTKANHLQGTHQNFICMLIALRTNKIIIVFSG